MYSCVSLLLLAGNLSREHMIRITIVRLVEKVHFRSDYDILGHDKASFPKSRFIRVGYVIVKDFCQVSISSDLYKIYIGHWYLIFFGMLYKIEIKPFLEIDFHFLK